MLILNGQSSLSFLITTDPVQCRVSECEASHTRLESTKQKQHNTRSRSGSTCYYTTYILNLDLKLRTHTSLSRPGFPDAKIKLDDGVKDRESADQKRPFWLKVGISSKLKMQSQAWLMILFLSLNLVYSMFKCGTSKVLITTFGSVYSTGEAQFNFTPKPLTLSLCVTIVVKLRSRSRSQVRSRSGPRSDPKGPRTKDQRPGPGLYIKFGLPPTHHHHHHHPVNFSWAENHSKPLLYDF